MNNSDDVKIEKIITIRQLLPKLIDSYDKASSDTRRVWLQEKIETLLKELKNEN